MFLFAFSEAELIGLEKIVCKTKDHGYKDHGYFHGYIQKISFSAKNYKDVFDLLNLTKQKDEKVKNEVHENKIWIERVTKEKYNAKLTTVCNPNPRLAFFQFTTVHAGLVDCFSGL